LGRARTAGDSRELIVPAATRRVNRGAGHSYYLDGEQIDGVTTVVREGVPKKNLIGWAARSVAGYAVDHWVDLDAQSPSARLRELERAAWAERDAAAVRGTTVHAIASLLAGGETVEVPEHLVGYVDGYLHFVEAYDVHEIEVEATVVHRGASRETSYMGTLDLLATFGASTTLPVLIDWKTGASGIWPETALQLAAYAHAQTILRDDGTEEPLPQIEAAFGVWLRADGYDVVPVDISDATFRVFQYAQQLAHFCDEPRSTFVREALPPRRLDEVTS
jgi:hypothetical protein